MTDYSNNLYPKSDSDLIEKFEKMLKQRDAYFFDVEEVEALVDYYMERSNNHKAKLAVNHGLELFPGSSALYLKQAQIFAAGKESEKALKILDYLEAAEPHNIDMLLFKAVVHRSLSDHEGTKSCLLKALKHSPENREEIFMDLAYEQQIANDYNGAIESLKESLRINPNHEASLFELSYCFEMADQIEIGVDFFQEYLNRHPYNFVAWYNLAMCYEKIGLYEKAVESAEFCLAIREDFVGAYILKGNLYTSMDLDREAMKAYKESLVHDNENPMVYTAIGECQERLGLWKSAELNYRKALGIDPDYLEAIMGLGAVREEEGDLKKAIAFYEQAVKKDDFHLDNKHILVEAYIKDGRIQKALKALEEIIAVFPDDAEAWVVKAELLSAETIDKAIETLRQAILQMPDDHDLKWNLVKYLFKAAKIEEGAELFANTYADQPEGIKYFLSIFPEAVQFSNIAGLIDIQEQAQEENEF